MSALVAKKQMSQKKITEVLNKVRLGQFLMVELEGTDGFSSSVKHKGDKRVILFNGKSICHSVSSWCLGNNGEKIISVKVDKACRRCPVSRIKA